MILPFMLLHIAGMTYMHHHIQSLVEMGSCELFAQEGTPDPPPQVARITLLSHKHLAQPFFNIYFLLAYVYCTGRICCDTYG
jgi:hypothetical protein